MKQEFAKRVSFAGKSLLWSLLFYSITTIILDWNKIINILQQKNDDTVIVKSDTNTSQKPASITTPVPLRHDSLRKINLHSWGHLFEATGAVLSRFF